MWYRLWDSEVIITGYNLLKVYEHLKDNLPEALEESAEVWQPGSTEPYIESIEHKDRP